MKKKFSFVFLIVAMFLLGNTTVNAEGYWQKYFGGKVITPTWGCGGGGGGASGLTDWQDLSQNHVIQPEGGCGVMDPFFYVSYQTSNIIFADVTNVTVKSSNPSVITAKVVPYDFSKEKKHYEDSVKWYTEWYDNLTDEEFKAISSWYGEYETKPTWWEFNGYEENPDTWWKAYRLDKEPTNAVEVISYGHDLGKAELTLSADNKEDITIKWNVMAKGFGAPYYSYGPVHNSEGLIEILNNLDKYKDVIPVIEEYRPYNFSFEISDSNADEDLSELINTLKGKDITVQFSSYGSDSWDSIGEILINLNGKDIKNTVDKGFTYAMDISFEESAKKKQIDTLVEAKDKIYIDFKYHGTLPTTTTLTIKLREALLNYYEEKNQCYEKDDYSTCLEQGRKEVESYLEKEYTLLYYNPDTRKMEVAQDNLKPVNKTEWSQEKVLNIDFDHFSSYVLVPKGEYTLTDKEVVEEYTITYNLNGGTNSSSNPSTYPENNKEIVLSNPTRVGYTFGGWYSDSSFKTKVTKIAKNSKGNITLYAKWTANSYTIKFNGNGSTSGKMTDVSNLKYGTSYTLKANAYKRTGYTFVGWNTKKDGTGVSYTNKASIKNLVSKNKGSITLYAIWKKNTYTITYKLNSGTNNKSNPATYTITTSKITLKNPTRTGYTFKGWYSDSKFKKKVTTIAKGSTGNKTLYAKWEANSYTIKFNGNGATSGKMSNVIAKYGKSYTLKSNPYKRTGYTFVGWNTKKDGTGTTYKNKASIKNLVSKNKGSITLYAQWKKNTYTITYKLNGGTNNSSNPATYTVTSNKITLKNPTRTGYTFKGWYSDSKFKKKVTTIAKKSTGNKTLYAKWEANSYTIKFNGNGATSGKMTDVSNLKYGKSYTLKANSYKKTGYTFVGWNTASDGTGISYTNKASISNLVSKNKETITLYAQWELIPEIEE